MNPSYCQSDVAPNAVPSTASEANLAPASVKAAETAPASPQPLPLDGRLLTIGVLSITACVLFVGLILVLIQPQPALAIGQSDRGGDYILLTQQASNSIENVVVIDAATQQIAIYQFDANQRRLALIDRDVSLARLPGVPQPGGNRPGSGKQP